MAKAKTASPLPALLSDLKALHDRCTRSTVEMERGELLQMSTPVLRAIRDALALGGSSGLPLSVVPVVLYFAGGGDGLRVVCDILALVADKRIFNLFSNDIDAAYGRATDKHLLFKSVQVTTKSYTDALLGDLEAVKKRIRHDASQLTQPAALNHAKAIDRVLLECAELVDVDFSSSCRLVSVLLDVFVMTKEEAVLRCAGHIALGAPCRHPLLPIVAVLLRDSGVVAGGVELVVFPRRSPVFTQRSVGVSVVCGGVEEVISGVEATVTGAQLQPVETRPVTAAAAVYQPAVTREIIKPEITKRPRYDDLPDLVLDGPDSAGSGPE